MSAGKPPLKTFNSVIGQALTTQGGSMHPNYPFARAAPILEIVGKILIAVLFWWDGILQGVMTWPDVVAFVAAQGLPFPSLVGAAATIFQILAPLALFWRRAETWAAIALAGYCLLTAVLFHNFWIFDGDDRIFAQIQFLKNLAIAGALFVAVSRQWAGMAANAVR
jgi:putative oxidoreductase